MTTHTKKSKTQTTSNPPVKLSDDPNLRRQIETRAFEIWLASGGGHGSDVLHWLQAEGEVRAGRQINGNGPT